MNVFVIPSWYPTLKNPLLGIFVWEEVVAMAEEYPDLSIVVSIDGSTEYFCDPRRPLKLLGILWKSFWVAKVKINYLMTNLVEIRGRCLGWPTGIFRGNIDGLIKVHRSNFIKAIEIYGKPQIIHAHVTYPAGWIAMILSKEFEIPYVIKECMGPFPFPKKYFINQSGKLTKWISEPLKGAQQIIVMSPFLASLIRAHDLVVHKIIPYPVDERRFKPSLKISPSSERRISFFSLCALSYKKGVDDLLHAISLAILEEPAIFFVIAGAGPLKHYKQLSLSLGISDHILWVGSVTRDEAIEYFNASDAFIMLSHFDTFGMVYAEALAMGKPIIATRCGGPEGIVSDISGLLVKVGDIAEIASSIIQMSRTHDKYDAVMIRDDFMKRFSRIKIVGEIVQCYQEILGK
jgi:glycosyltransferase involved in cell wall biosynthesis